MNSKIKATDLTRSFATVVSHIKDQVRNNVVTAHRRSLVKGLEDNQVKQICNIIDSSVEQAAANAINSESMALMKIIEAQQNELLALRNLKTTTSKKSSKK